MNTPESLIDQLIEAAQDVMPGFRVDRDELAVLAARRQSAIEAISELLVACKVSADKIQRAVDAHYGNGLDTDFCVDLLKDELIPTVKAAIARFEGE